MACRLGAGEKLRLPKRFALERQGVETLQKPGGPCKSCELEKTMPKRWSGSVATLAGLLAAVVPIAPAPVAAATVLERTIDVEVRPDGSVLERTHLRVRLD